MSRILNGRPALSARLRNASWPGTLCTMLCLFALAAPAEARPPWPLNGTYQLSGLRVCTGSLSPAPSAPALFRTETAQVSFTPVARKAFADWLTELADSADAVIEPPGWEQGTTMLSNTANPAEPGTLLIETAVEWGKINSANFRSEIGAPGAVIKDSLKTGPTWFFVTQYGFGEGAALDTFITGYALYVWKDETESWLRYVVTLNSKLTFTAASAVGHAAYEKELGGVAYRCVRQIQLHQ